MTAESGGSLPATPQSCVESEASASSRASRPSRVQWALAQRAAGASDNEIRGLLRNDKIGKARVSQVMSALKHADEVAVDCVNQK